MQGVNTWLASTV